MLFSWSGLVFRVQDSLLTQPVPRRDSWRAVLSDAFLLLPVPSRLSV